MVQDYSGRSTYAWSTAGYPAGTYRLEVDVRDVSTAAAYDAVKEITDVLQTCSAGRLAADRPSPQPPGTSVVLTGSATCGGAAEYRFWVRAPGGAWKIARDYAPSSSFTWNTPSTPRGYYGVEVDVRSVGSTAAYETVANLTYLVDACTSAHVSVSPASPQKTGTIIVVTGTASCAGTPEYRFWVRAPGGAWIVARDYSTTATFTWTTAGKAAGTYGLEVDVRDQGSGAAYDTVANLAYVLNP